MAFQLMNNFAYIFVIISKTNLLNNFSQLIPIISKRIVSTRRLGLQVEVFYLRGTVLGDAFHW